MKMCIKCKTYLAAPDSDYCFNCQPSDISTSQSQTSTESQNQTQDIQDTMIKVKMQQEQIAGGTQDQSFSKTSPTKGASKSDLTQINQKLDTISEDLDLVKTYTSQIEPILNKLDQLDDLELYLRDRLSTDWEKIQDYWNSMKTGQITRGEFVVQGIKILGRKFVNFMVNFL